MSSLLLNRIHDRFFRWVHESYLIYNTCWEDPRIDRKLLQLNGKSRVVMITSAGCNALDYLLDDPEKIYAVDMNPYQNALLELKIAAIRHCPYEDFFALFGKGYHPKCRQIYNMLARDLSEGARNFWEHRLYYFAGHRGRRPSFYYHGTTGTLAWLFLQFFFRHQRDLKTHIFKLLDASDLKEQRCIYERIEPGLWTSLTRRIVNQPATLTMMGVPRSQIQLIKQQYPGGLIGFVKDKMHNVFTNVSIQDNYFWRVYITGSYTQDCCPNYLKRKNFSRLKSRINQIQMHTSTLSDFLRQHPGIYTHYVLLDHQDWLAGHDPASLEDEWQLILNNSQNGTRILMRSAGLTTDFLPGLAASYLRFFPEKTVPLHKNDRVGTYGSLHFAHVLYDNAI